MNLHAYYCGAPDRHSDVWAYGWPLPPAHIYMYVLNVPLSCGLSAAKVLPTEGMNINSLNIRGGVFAAVAAFDAPVDKSTLSASSGLALVVQRGASEEQLLKHGVCDGAF